MLSITRLVLITALQVVFVLGCKQSYQGTDQSLFQGRCLRPFSFGGLVDENLPTSGRRPLPLSAVSSLSSVTPSGAGQTSADFSRTSLLPVLPACLVPSNPVCLKHRLVPVPIQVVEECITNVPVVRKAIIPRVETITRHVPIHEKIVTQQHEKIVHQVPIAQKFVHNVIETRVRHVPVIKSRSRTVVEPFTVHEPITLRFTRPVEEYVTKNVPAPCTRLRPVIVKRTRLVPVIHRRLRPIVESTITTIPVRRSFVKNVVELRARRVFGQCDQCSKGLAQEECSSAFDDSPATPKPYYKTEVSSFGPHVSVKSYRQLQTESPLKDLSYLTIPDSSTVQGYGSQQHEQHDYGSKQQALHSYSSQQQDLPDYSSQQQDLHDYSTQQQDLHDYSSQQQDLHDYSSQQQDLHDYSSQQQEYTSSGPREGYCGQSKSH